MWSVPISPCPQLPSTVSRIPAPSKVEDRYTILQKQVLTVCFSYLLSRSMLLLRICAVSRTLLLRGTRRQKNRSYEKKTNNCYKITSHTGKVRENLISIIFFA